MNAISSHKPFERSLEVAENQLAAKKTWTMAFGRIIYFGEEEPALAGPDTMFIPCQDFPLIRDMVKVCAEQPDWSCIINADIQVSQKMPQVDRELDKAGALSAVSMRFQKDAHGKLAVTDFGLDFFAAKQPMWEAVLKEIPDVLRIGHNLWDTWMVSFFVRHSNGHCYDLTPSRLFFHPQHECRERPYSIEKKDMPGNTYIEGVGWPRTTIWI